MMTTNVHKNYEAFLEKRNTLISLIDRQISLLLSLSIDTEIDSLQKLRERVSTDVFKVLVVGEFKRGKSTFINAMLGQAILPAYATPCTAVINEVKWGESPRALVHYSTTEGDSKRQIETIRVEAIEKYVVIPENPAENYVNPYEKVEIFYPLELCRSGVEIIDSPGLNEHLTRTQVTESYLPVVDAIIFMFTCEALASQSEIQFIENILKPLGHHYLFFVCNKFDQIRKDNEKERVRKFAVSNLAPLTKLGENGIYFVSAFNALEGRLNRDDERVNNSGVPFFERDLAKFLIANRGKLKILEPAKDMQESIKKARCTIPEREALLKISQGELEKRYLETQGTFDALETRRKQIETRIVQSLEDTKIRISEDAYNFLRILPSKIEEWASVYKFNFDNLEPMFQELSNYIDAKLEAEIISWHKNYLDDILIPRIESLKQDIDDRIFQFADQANYLRTELSFNAISFNQETVNRHKVLGKAFGSSILKTSLLAGGVVGGIGLISLAFPLALHPLATSLYFLVKGLKETWNQNKRPIKDIIREDLVSRYSSNLEKNAKQYSISVTNQLMEKLETIKDTIVQGLEKEIQSIKDQVESVLDEKKKGQATVFQKIDELQLISQRLNDLEGELDDLINQLNPL